MQRRKVRVGANRCGLKSRDRLAISLDGWMGFPLIQNVVNYPTNHHLRVHNNQIHPDLQQIPPTALLNFACDWLALYRDISFGWLTSPSV